MSKKKTITALEAVLKFKKSMQKICNDPTSGVTSISITSPSYNKGKEVIIAEKKK